MSDETYAEMIAAACHTGDTEGDHVQADDLILAALRELGFEKTAQAWESVNKWYA